MTKEEARLSAAWRVATLPQVIADLEKAISDALAYGNDVVLSAADAALVRALLGDYLSQLSGRY